jgi:hypothetical protein
MALTVTEAAGSATKHIGRDPEWLVFHIGTPNNDGTDETATLVTLPQGTILLDAFATVPVVAGANGEIELLIGATVVWQGTTNGTNATAKQVGTMANAQLHGPLSADTAIIVQLDKGGTFATTFEAYVSLLVVRATFPQ